MLGATDRRDRLTKVEQYRNTVMLRVTRQVQIEANVIEVELRTVREADTVARVRHRETIVIAALLQAREPIGSVKRRKTDLVILLTPTLMAR